MLDDTNSITPPPNRAMLTFSIKIYAGSAYCSLARLFLAADMIFRKNQSPRFFRNCNKLGLLY